MKKLLAVFVSLFVVSSVAFAKPSVESDFTTMSKADSQFLFQEGAKVASLDQAEMKSTEGRYGWWGALAGGSVGAYGYIGRSMSSGHFSWRGLAGATLGGAVAGTVLPTPTAAMWAARSHAAMFGGFTSGWFF